MTSRRKWIAMAGTVAIGLTLLAIAGSVLVPRHGLRRAIFTQVGFAGTPVVEHATAISLDFLNERPDLPRQNVGVRWRGFLYVPEEQSIEFFAGGNDEVELRIDDKVVLRRNLTEGMRTIGSTLTLSPGSHALAVDYQQFTGGMSLNVQRAIAGDKPGPFLPSELFVDRVEPRHIWMIAAADSVRQSLPIAWGAFAVLLLVVEGRTAAARWRVAFAPKDARDYVSRLSIVAAPAMLAPAVIFLVGTHTIFANNRAEYATGFGELVAPWLLRSAALTWLVLFAAGAAIALLSERWARFYAAGLFAAGLLLWGQGNLWNADYGILAGQDIDLAQHAGRSPYELTAWAGVLLLALLFFRSVSRLAPFTTLVFLGLQAVAIVFTGAQTDAARAGDWLEPPAAIFQFSGTRNVIHIVLDEFQSDVFNDIFEQDRAALDRRFTGFQYFADHAGAFPTTSFSMPAMLTGREYRNEKPAPEFIRDVFRRDSIFEKVSRAGYDVDAASIVPIDSFDEWMGSEARPNWKGARFKIVKPFVSREDYRMVSARELAELSLFRHVPHAVKAFGTAKPDVFYRALWMDRTESPAEVRRHEASNSVAFLEQFIGRMSVGRDRAVYKLLHVGVPHRPIVVDRECRYIGLTAMSRESYTEQSRCAVKLVAELLDRLRALGIYDSSLIIVSSDHGTDLDPLGFEGRSDILSLIPGPSTVRLPAIVSTAKAVMLIKPPDRTGPMVRSQAPTSHVDLQATILDILGLPGGSPADSMLRRNPAMPRTRVFGMYDPHIRFPKQYLDRVDVLTIDRRVLDGSGWNVRQLIWRPDLQLDGSDVDVGPRAANLYLGPGWSLERRERIADSHEITFVQALTPRTIISVSLPRTAAEIVLRASSPSEAGVQSIRVDVDGKPAPPLFPTGANGYSDLVITVPANPARPAVSEVTLHFDAGGRDDFVFKLDRLRIKERRTKN